MLKTAEKSSLTKGFKYHLMMILDSGLLSHHVEQTK